MSKDNRDNFKPCRICLSPYRKEIEREIKMKVPVLQVAHKYTKYFPIATSTLNILLAKHMEEHLKYASSIIVLENKEGVITKNTIENYAQKVLDLGFKMLETNPTAFAPKDIVSVQTLLVKRQALSLQEDAMKLHFARLFGGVGMSLEEGEVVDGELKPGEPQDPTAVFLPDKE